MRRCEARYKVYIIDEVHMLSTAAFNALLKTLEEPPPHAKFIFATTEIRKVPVTILSRCQRFDLRRVEPEVIAANLAAIAEAEGARIEADALALIARAAEGSVRDAQSLLDQAHGAGRRRRDWSPPTAVRDMLGLADRAQTIDLFEQAVRGEAAEAIEAFRTLYGFGADPVDGDARPAGALPRRRRSPRRSARTRWGCPRTRPRGWRPSARPLRPAASRGCGRCC